MPRSMILYSRRALDCQKLVCGGYVCVGHGVWVRYEIVDEDVIEALALATPRPGEIVLNSIPLD